MDFQLKFAGHASSSQRPDLEGWFDQVEQLLWTASMGDPKSGLGLSFVKPLDALSPVLWRKSLEGSPFRYVKVRCESPGGPSVVHLESVVVSAIGTAFEPNGMSEQVSLDAAAWWVE